MSEADLCSGDLPAAAPCLSAPRVESPEQASRDSSSSPHRAVDKVSCQDGARIHLATPTKRRYETHSTDSAEKCGPRPKLSKLSLAYVQRGSHNGTLPVLPSVPSDNPAKETGVRVVPSNVSAKDTGVPVVLGDMCANETAVPVVLSDRSSGQTAVSEELSTPSVNTCESVAESTASPGTTPEKSSATPDGTGRARSPHDSSGSALAGCVGSVQKQAASVASRLPTAFANWSPSPLLSSKLANRAPKDRARSPISIPSISSTSVLGQPGDAAHSSATAKEDAALVWCKCGFGPVDRVAFDAHSVATHVTPFCHGCNLCGEKFAARKDLKCHFSVHSEVRESHAENDSRLVEGVAGQSESRAPNASNSPLGAGLSSPVGRVAGATDDTDPSDSKTGKSYWLLRPDLDGSLAMIRFFKCVIGQCRFTADLPADFAGHLSSHKLAEMGDLVCIYCGQTFDAIATLVQHMERIHRNLTFQCSHCLYRSALPIHNYLHHAWWHRLQKREFYICKNPGLHTGGVGLPTQHVSLTHYWCSITNCDFKSFNPEVFDWHLRAAHPKTKNYSCYNCEERVNSPQALLQHCVKHDMDVVQCGVCHHSEPSYKKMLRHLCECHPDSPLEISFRTGGQAAEFEKYVRKLQGSFELSAGDVPDSADSSSDVDGLPVLTPQSLYSRREPEEVVWTGRSSVKTCPFCSHRLVSLEDITEHCVIAHQIRLGISAILDLMLKAKHVSTERDESLRCPFCDVAPSDKDELERHMFEEFEYTPMQCEACGYSTVSREGLKEHFRVGHPQRRPTYTVRRHDDFESWVAGFVAAQEARRTVLEKPYQCLQCAERHRCTKELRMHLYAHLQYFPHHCTICEKCFTSQQDVEEHQRTLHAVTDVYSIEEVRFENKEVKIDDFIDEATAKLRAVVESPPGRQCMWMGCPYSSSNSAELIAHMKAHIEQRNVCTTCQFSSYCDDVLAWHSRQHSPVSSSTEVLPNFPVVASSMQKAKSRAYACCWCSFRAPTSMEIRTHCKVTHPGKAVKLVAPKRKDFHAPVARRMPSTDTRRREDTTNEGIRTRGVNEMMDVGEQRNVLTPTARGSVVRQRQPVYSTSRGNLSQLADRTLAVQQFKCRQCNFLASSPRLRHLHESIFHVGGMVFSTPGLNVFSAVSRLLGSPAEDPSGRQDQGPAVVGGPSPSPRSAPRLARGESTCRACFKHFSSRLLLFHHLAVVHHVYGVCDTCGTNLMNRTNAQLHISVKHLPQQATFTVLRSKEPPAAPLPAAAISGDARSPPLSSVPSTVTKSGNICVIPLDGCDEPVPFSVYAQQHNVNPQVCLKDIAKQLHCLV
ncbi:hypothetical protein HPB48_025091 [Haemaphysalis longicornis]|uniref:C2H2-type domain-containing protein n=1 Tax=Haemaphysalis longicornis TaxID=44386 RepID=A0A9J6GYN2_HAELO|nr:hypothetical protein HPB48_025091 [Haemaphysalis longicornis]